MDEKLHFETGYINDRNRNYAKVYIAYFYKSLPNGKCFMDDETYNMYVLGEVDESLSSVKSRAEKALTDYNNSRIIMA